MIVLGLGNPGEHYRSTRHNVGFRVVDGLAQRWGVRLRRPLGARLRARIARTRFAGEEVVLAQPMTYMNRVGQAAGRLLERFEADAGQLLVLHDDADLALGRLRLRPSGGTGGHNGVRSLLDTLHTASFPRLKLGVRGRGRTGELADYVLQDFDDDELETVEQMIETGARAVEMVLERGLESAMNRFNRPASDVARETEHE